MSADVNWYQNRPTHVPARTGLSRCSGCGHQTRYDEPMEKIDYNIMDQFRHYYQCTNMDCKFGPGARWLKDQIRHDPCPSCKCTGLTPLEDGFCEAECRYAELLRKDLFSEFLK